MNVVPVLAIGAGLIVENVVAYAFDLNSRIANGCYAIGAVFFLLSLSPHTAMGFALTARDWGDQWRDWLGIMERPAVSHARLRWAAHKSIVIHTLFALLGLAFACASPEGPDEIGQSCMAGTGIGFWGGYLAVMGRRG